jgi:hypothetical protein
MTTKIFLSTVLVLTIASCNNTHTQEKPKQEIPKALEDKNASYELLSKRGYDDLVETIYSELVSKNFDLQKLEDKIDELNKSKTDTTYLFNKFNEKNQSYFVAANKHIEEITDSLLKNKMRNLIANHLTKYNTSIVKQNDLIKIIEAKNLTIADLHNVLKIVKTLPIIEKFQQDNLPNTTPLEGYIKLQDETIKFADTLSKK